MPRGRGTKRKRPPDEEARKSDYRGVSWYKQSRQWRAQIGHGGRKHYLGDDFKM